MAFACVKLADMFDKISSMKPIHYFAPINHQKIKSVIAESLSNVDSSIFIADRRDSGSRP
jgi:hypothetical protein